jgi:hypothetical protein
MLILTAMLSCVAWVTIAFVPVDVNDNYNSASVTSAVNGSDTASAVASDEQETSNRRTVLFLVSATHAGITASFVFVSWTCNMKHVRTYALQVLALFATVGAFVLHYGSGGADVSRNACGLASLLHATLASGMWSYSFLTENDADDGRTPLGLAAARAGSRAEGKVWKPKSRKEKAKIALMISQASMFNFAINMVLSIGMIALYQAYDNLYWKLFVTALAWVIKVVGNKVMLNLMWGNIAM